MANQPSGNESGKIEGKFEGKSEKTLSKKELAVLSARDITPLLSSWDYEPGTINVRKIIGLDGVTKIQMRIELGLMQMELTGRPDGARPHGCESLLEYHEKQLAEHRAVSGSAEGFHLTRQQCQSLHHEASMYYQRYLSLFVLEDFPAVIRDTARNLRVLEMCSKYAVDEHDRLFLEQYRPYITMMHARATAMLLMREGRTADAYRSVRKSLGRIKRFFEGFNQPQAFKHSNEVKVLKRLAREIKAKLPVDPLEALQKQLDNAIKAERYEEAAKLRDEIARMTAAK